ncbi:hypothetical protein CLOM_g15003 [Closterium sp. NIES-68]|nr:hypothetical protein CLOM_g15003 [Closterium sp. NIES-68]GJP66239.1 hypothetical protein CLOP_g23136 [Closterium sp. NIES-67]
MATSHDDNITNLLPSVFNGEDGMDVEESIDTRVLEDYREGLGTDATIHSRDVCSLNQHELGLLNRNSLRMGTGISQRQKRPSRKFDITMKPLPYEELANSMKGPHVPPEKERSKMKRQGTGRVKKRRPFGLRTPNFADDEEFEEEDEEVHAVFSKKDQPSRFGEDQMRLEDLLQKKTDVRAGSMVWNSLVLNPSGHTGNSRELAQSTVLDSVTPEDGTHLHGSEVKNLNEAFGEEFGTERVEDGASPVTEATQEVEHGEAAHQAEAEKYHDAEGDNPMSCPSQPAEAVSGPGEAMEGMVRDDVSGAEQDAELGDEDEECHVVEIMCSEQANEKPDAAPVPAVVEVEFTSSVPDAIPTTPVAPQPPSVVRKSAMKSGRKSARKSVTMADPPTSSEGFAMLPFTPEAGSYLTKQKKSAVQKEKLRDLCNRRSSLAGGGLIWDGNIRKSTRTRMKPLEWWRLEVVNYGRPHQSLPTPVEVQVCSPEPYWPAVPPGGLRKRVGVRKMAMQSLRENTDARILAIE